VLGGPRNRLQEKMGGGVREKRKRASKNSQYSVCKKGVWGGNVRQKKIEYDLQGDSRIVGEKKAGRAGETKLWRFILSTDCSLQMKGRGP